VAAGVDCSERGGSEAPEDDGIQDLSHGTVTGASKTSARVKTIHDSLIFIEDLVSPYTPQIVTRFRIDM
jgi:hypothetical protein